MNLRKNFILRILYSIIHTEDDHVDNRKELYKAEGVHYYTGNIFVPDDLEVMEF